MIMPMRKIHFIFHSSQLDNDIQELQEFGIVDIKSVGLNTDTNMGKEYRNVLDALQCLAEVESTNVQYLETESINYGMYTHDIVNSINKYHQEKLTLLKQNEELQILYDEVKPFGEVSNTIINDLNAHNISVTLYKTARKATLVRNLPKEILIEKVHMDSQNSFFAVIRYNDVVFTPPVSWSVYSLPDQVPRKILDDIEINKKQIHEIDQCIRKYLVYSNTVNVRKVELENILMQQSVIDTSQSFEENQLFVVQGFIPQESVATLYNHTKDKSWGIVISMPSEDEEVPTLTKNFSFIKIIKPLFKLMDTIPGYREFDISALFLLFITLFYSMIIGDAGYGLLMFIITAISFLLSVRKNKATLTHGLLLWFSAATIVWGAMTGNWFGYSGFLDIPFLNSLVFDPIANTNGSSKETIMLFCFRVGIVHLQIAHLWKAIRVVKDGILSVLHELANGSLLLGLYFVTLTLLLDPDKYPLPNFALPLILGSFGCIIITSEQQKGRNFFVGVGKGIANLFTLFLSGVGALADLISYIRLFAVGLASLAIAQAFNDMGLSIIQTAASPAVSVILWIAGILVMAFGHTLNLAMGLLAVMVHGVRLNMLEFGMHLGMEWTGRTFTPFRKKFISLEEQ